MRGGGRGRGVPEAIEWPCLEFTLQLPGLEAKEGNGLSVMTTRGSQPPESGKLEPRRALCGVYPLTPTLVPHEGQLHSRHTDSIGHY